MESLLNKIKELYGLDVSSPERVEKGFLSENHFLSSGDKRFFLKKYRFENVRRIIEVHASKEYFSQGGIPVILPINQNDGNTFFELDGSFYALFPYVEGKQYERGKITDKGIISLGTMLGYVHLLGKDSKLDIDDFFKIEDETKTNIKIEAILAKIHEKETLDEFDKVALKNVELKKKMLGECIKDVSSLGLRSDHLIHGDFLDHNVFFDENDEVKNVFDFEKTCYSPRTYELFRSMFYMLTDEVSDGNLARAKLYLDSYSKVYPISNEEIEAGIKLFFIKSIHGFWTESEHYLKGSTRVDEFIFADVGRIEYMSENLNRIIDFLKV